ncbi:hypothetical protein AB0N88_37455 [Streptomyces sp. NPDC093516]|uniref:hypothetical protein n=1 Tax=Streptomyces sp. NPDC093516 TaxID=3155304 RepID=UPI0034226F71
MHSQNHSNRRPLAYSEHLTAAQAPASNHDALGGLSEDEFADAVLVRADEPDDDRQDGIPISLTEFAACSPEPLRLVVLMHWRFREKDGEPRSAEAIWAALTALGINGDDDEPVTLEQVDSAMAFLISEGLITVTPGGAL